jgi:hypothetical protein
MAHYGRHRREHYSTGKAGKEPLTEDNLPEFCTLGYENSGEYKECTCDDDRNSKVSSVEESSDEDAWCKDKRVLDGANPGNGGRRLIGELDIFIVCLECLWLCLE